jgi:hypothetical protein
VVNVATDAATIGGLSVRSGTRDLPGLTRSQLLAPLPMPLLPVGVDCHCSSESWLSI